MGESLFTLNGFLLKQRIRTWCRSEKSLRLAVLWKSYKSTACFLASSFFLIAKLLSALWKLMKKNVITVQSSDENPTISDRSQCGHKNWTRKKRCTLVKLVSQKKEMREKSLKNSLEFYQCFASRPRLSESIMKSCRGKGCSFLVLLWSFDYSIEYFARNWHNPRIQQHVMLLSICHTM